MNSNLALILMVVFLAVVCAVFLYLFMGEPAIDQPHGASKKSLRAGQEDPQAPQERKPAAADEELNERTRAAEAQGAKAKGPADGALAISGKVTDARGKPLQVALVQALAGDKAYETTSLVGGLFEFRDLPEGMYTIEASKPDYATARRENVHTGTRDLILHLDQPSAVSGTVLSSVGNAPLTDIEVAAIPEPPHETPVIQLLGSLPWVRFQNPDGHFHLEGIPTGARLLVVARSEGYAPGYMAVPPVARGRNSPGLVFRLGPAACVAGHVVTADGLPVEGASIHLGEDASSEPMAETDADGRFSITTLPAGDATLTATHPDYVSGRTSVSVQLQTTVETEIVLEQGGTVEGTVVDGAQPVPNHLVRILVPGDYSRPSLDDESGEDGRYRIPNVPAVEVRVAALMPGQDSHSSRPVVRRALVQAGQVTVVDFDFSATYATIEGAVLVDGRAPRRGAVSVAVSGELGQDSRVVTLDANGYYRAEDLLPGAVSVQANVVGRDGVERRKTVKLEVAENEAVRQDFEFMQAATVYGTVTGVPDGKKGSVFAVAGGGEQFNVTSLEDILNLHNLVAADAEVSAGGAYQLDGLAPGAYTIVAIAAGDDSEGTTSLATGVRSGARVVNIEAGTQMEVNLTLR